MDEQKQAKEQLDRELREIHFTKQREVLTAIRKPTWRKKLNNLWNKEVSIPLFPVSSLLVILLFSFGLYTVNDINQDMEPRKLIEIGDSIYWKQEMEGRMSDEK